MTEALLKNRLQFIEANSRAVYGSFWRGGSGSEKKEPFRLIAQAPYAPRCLLKYKKNVWYKIVNCPGMGWFGMGSRKAKKKTLD